MKLTILLSEVEILSMICLIKWGVSSAIVKFASELELLRADEPGTLAISLQSRDSSAIRIDLDLDLLVSDVNAVRFETLLPSSVFLTSNHGLHQT